MAAVRFAIALPLAAWAMAWPWPGGLPLLVEVWILLAAGAAAALVGAERNGRA